MKTLGALIVVGLVLAGAATAGAEWMKGPIGWEDATQTGWFLAATRDSGGKFATYLGPFVNFDACASYLAKLPPGGACDHLRMTRLMTPEQAKGEFNWLDEYESSTGYFTYYGPYRTKDECTKASVERMMRPGNVMTGACFRIKVSRTTP